MAICLRQDWFINLYALFSLQSDPSYQRLSSHCARNLSPPPILPAAPLPLNSKLVSHVRPTNKDSWCISLEGSQPIEPPFYITAGNLMSHAKELPPRPINCDGQEYHIPLIPLLRSPTVDTSGGRNGPESLLGRAATEWWSQKHTYTSIFYKTKRINA